MRPPSVWVVILNWNGGQETLDCLRSLRASSYPAHVLVVDNGSSDASCQRVARSFAEVEIMALPSNKGFSHAANLGIKRAMAQSADYILLLNNDTLVAPTMLERMVEHAEAHPKCGLLSPLIYQADHPERFWVVGGTWALYAVLMHGWDTRDTGQYADPTAFDIVFGTALLIRRSVLETIGLFDERFFVYYEDVDLGLRARRAGYGAAVIPQARIWHSGSSSTRRRQYIKEFYLARSRVLLFRKHLPGIHFLVFMLLQLRDDLRVYWSFLRHGQLLCLAAAIGGSLGGLCRLLSWQEGRQTHEFQANQA